MKIKLSFLILALIMPNVSKAEDTPTTDHLIPENSIWGLYDYQLDYYSLVRKVLMKDLSDRSAIRLVTLPSFSPESVLQIDSEYLIYRIPTKMIWTNTNLVDRKVEDFKIIEYRVKIDSRSIELIKSLFLKAVKQTRYPETNSFGLDGTSYYFFAWEHGLKSGKTWSPNTPKMLKLVEITEKLIFLAKEKTDLISFDDDFTKEIETLTQSLDE